MPTRGKSDRHLGEPDRHFVSVARQDAERRVAARAGQILREHARQDQPDPVRNALLGLGADRAVEEVLFVGREVRRRLLAEESVVDEQPAERHQHEQDGDDHDADEATSATSYRFSHAPQRHGVVRMRRHHRPAESARARRRPDRRAPASGTRPAESRERRPRRPAATPPPATPPDGSGRDRCRPACRTGSRGSAAVPQSAARAAATPAADR